MIPTEWASAVGSVAYGASVFALVVGVVAAPSYGVVLLLERHSNLGHGLALLVVFLLVGVVACLIGVGSDHVLFGLAAGAILLALGVGMWGRGHGRGDSYRPSGLPTVFVGLRVRRRAVSHAEGSPTSSGCARRCNSSPIGVSMRLPGSSPCRVIDSTLVE